MNWLDLLLGPALMALLMLLWQAVAHLWRRTFELPGQTDVLAARGDCSSCGTSCARFETCQSRNGTTDLKEEHHD